MNQQFWDQLLAEDATAIREEFADLWQKAGAGPISQAQAVLTLDLMWQRTHLDLKDFGLQAYYPTAQGGPWGGLTNIKYLFWVDHATAGVSGKGTLSWFSSKKRQHARKFKTEVEAHAHYGSRKPGAKVYSKGNKWYVSWKGYAGAVTHFVEDFDGVPFYILKIKHCCWGEPRRNRDSIHIEMVNPLTCQLKNDRWHFWAGPISQKVLDKGLIPVDLDKPFRGAKNFMPYTWQQVISNIKLKRLCIAATGAMARERMSDHTDWRTTKFDMGPLWPRDMINDAAFDVMPIEEYDFMKHFVTLTNMDDVVDPAELQAIDDGTYDIYDMDDNTPADVEIDSTTETQVALISIYGVKALPKYGADGDLGPETCHAVRHFQEDWNKNQPKDLIKVDGIPGTETWGRLKRALVMGLGFITRAFD